MLIVEFCLFSLTDIGYRLIDIAAWILIPLVSVYLAFDKSNPQWLRGLAFGIIIPFWPIAFFIFIDMLRGEGFAAGLTSVFILIPATLIGALMGLIIGIVLEKIKTKK